MSFEKLKAWWKGRQKKAFSTNYTCIRCGKEVFDHAFFCDACRKKLPIQGPFTCPHCGRKTEQGGGVCQRCKFDPPFYLRAKSAFSYEGDVVGYVKAFKNGDQFYSVLFGRELEEFLPFFPKADYLIPVPLTEKKLKKRGYNQALLLAEYLSEAWHIPVMKDLVYKTDEGEEQKTLTRKERKENVKGLYQLNGRSVCKGKSFLIVDDVMTTGATVNEIARILKRAGANLLYVVTAAATPLRDFEK